MASGSFQYPERHGRAAVHEFADLAGVAGSRSLAEHEHLGAGDRLADRGRLSVDELGSQVGASERLGEAVHQEEIRVGLAPPQATHRLVSGAAPRCLSSLAAREAALRKSFTFKS